MDDLKKRTSVIVQPLGGGGHHPVGLDGETSDLPDWKILEAIETESAPA